MWVVLGKVGFSGFLRGNRKYLGNYRVILVSVCIVKAYFIFGKIKTFKVSSCVFLAPAK